MTTQLNIRRMDASKQSKRQREFEGFEDSDSDDPTRQQKKPRFPKGKKKKEDDVNEVEEQIFEGEELEEEKGPIKGTDPKFAATQRATRRKFIPEEVLNNSRNSSFLDDIGDADLDAIEHHYDQDEAVLEDDGVKLEPFNLKQEREEGYFDSAGNYVEYNRGNEIRDAWLDTVAVDDSYAPEEATKSDEETGVDDSLTAEQIGKINRHIADILEPGETVLQALRRLKGTSNKNEKMPPERKAMFDQLTENAMKLLDNGDYDVYNEKKSTFQREAEGYEALSQAKRGIDVANVSSTHNNASLIEEDIFADDEAEPKANGGAPDSDYVYDATSGFYYSSKHGYYYDPNSGLFCNAETSKWYKFNEETNAYDEIQDATV